MYAIFNSVKSVLLTLALCLFIMGCTNDTILDFQEESFEESLSSKNDESLTAKGKQRLHFNASLSAKNVVPHEDFNYTNATGVAIVTISKDETMVHFKVNVANIIDVTAAHFHTAMAGYNGGVVATIYPGTAPNGKMQGLLAEGYVTSLNGMTMEEFIWAIRNGGIYVNVHTSGNPGGEIRGQL